MELDGYSAEFTLAFECDGMQHRTRVEHFQRNEGDFEAQKSRDEEKDYRAIMSGIDLIRIPDRGVLRAKNIRQYVHAEIQECGYPDGVVNTQLCSDIEFYRNVRGLRARDVYGDVVRGLALAKGGVLVSEVCPTTTYPIAVDCGKGHQFQTDLENLRRGRWCPDCSPTRKKTDEEIQRVVEARGYAFVSTESVATGNRYRRYITIQCATSTHPPVSLSWSNFAQNKRGCKLCGCARRGKANSLSTETVNAETSKLGLKLIGPYKTRSTPTMFECVKEAHKFTSCLLRLRNTKGPRCPVCTLESSGDIRLLTPTGPEVDLGKGKLRFECGTCNGKFEATLRSMRMRKHKCPNKNCTSRQ